jgi:ketosteroid isomerase-like protein
VRGYLDAWVGQGIEGALDHLDPRVQVDWSRSDGPFSGTYTGHDGFRELFGGFLDVIDEYWMEPHEFIAAGPHVVVPNTSHFRARHGAEVIARGTLVFTVREGRIMSITLFQERAEALEAVGLPE